MVGKVGHRTVVLAGALARRDIIQTTQWDGSQGISRLVSLEKVEPGEVTYRGERVPVFFLTGRDLENGQQVQLAGTRRKRWTVIYA